MTTAEGASTTPRVGAAEAGRRPRGPRRWHRLPIVLRLVLAVAVTMSLILGGAAGLVYWRVQHALDEQLDADLATYYHELRVDLLAGHRLGGPDGSAYQVLDTRGRIIQASDLVRTRQLLTASDITSVTRGATVRRDIGGLLPLDPHTLRLKAQQVRLPGHSTVIAVAALRRGHRDEALRELLAQLAIAAGLTLLAAAHGGTAHAENTGHGAAVTLDLPC